MKVTGLDGKTYSWKLNSKPRSTASKPHKRCRALLKSLYPLDLILEEVSLPGSGKLYLDFYLPLRRISIEVQGQQHENFIPFFHPNKLEFFKAKKRDKNKAEWCELNTIKLISLSDEESDDEWRRRLIQQKTDDSRK